MALLEIAIYGRSGAALLLAAEFWAVFRLYMHSEEQFFKGIYGEVRTGKPTARLLHDSWDCRVTSSTRLSRWTFLKERLSHRLPTLPRRGEDVPAINPLPEELHERLPQQAFREHTSMAELIRMKLDLQPEVEGAVEIQNDPLLAVAGIGSDGSLTKDIDKDLYGI